MAYRETGGKEKREKKKKKRRKKNKKKRKYKRRNEEQVESPSGSPLYLLRIIKNNPRGPLLLFRGSLNRP